MVDADWRNCDGGAGDVENGFSMLAAGKKKASETMQTSLPNKKKSDYCLPKDRIYLDICSTYISFFNSDLLEDIRQVSNMILGHTNVGTSKTNWVGNFGGLEAWLDTNGIANIFGIPALKKSGYHITYDSDDGFYIGTNKTTGVSVKFREGDDGLPYIQATEENKAFVQSVALNFVQTVRKNYEGFTNRDVNRDVLYCKATGLIVYPYERDIKYLVSSNLTDFPVTIPDINNARKIYGPILCGTKGKTVSQKVDHVMTDYVAIPRDFLALHRFVYLVSDVMFFINITFLITMPCGIKFVTV